jgi:hypothetical protein
MPSGDPLSSLTPDEDEDSGDGGDDAEDAVWPAEMLGRADRI